MRKFFSQSLGIIIPLCLAIFLLILAFQKVSFDEFVAKSDQTDFKWVFISIVLSLASYAIRAWRWNMLLNPLNYYPSVFRTTLAVLNGYLANLAVPRLGEVTRCATLKKTNDVPVTISVGSVITERIVDLFSLLTVLLIALIIEHDQLISFIQLTFDKYAISTKKLIYISVILIAVLLSAALVLIFGNSKRLIRIKRWLLQIITGLISIRKLKNPFLFILSTVALWVIYYFMSYIIIYSLPETSHLSAGAGLMMLVTGGVALAIPVQGGIGTYHTLMSAMLLLYGIDATTGLFFATLLHSSQMIAIIIFGGASTVLSGYLQKITSANAHDLQK
jgi:uncharacterized membrane protein YbhN (UPF0104 family)